MKGGCSTSICLFTSVLLFSGCLSFSEPGEDVSASTRDTVSRIASTTSSTIKKPVTTATTLQTTTTTSTTLPECPFECCEHKPYGEKTCGEGESCVNHTCFKTCPHECCEPGGDYTVKECQHPMKCVNNRCLKERCPYECCDGSGRYMLKACNKTWRCVNNHCFPADTDGDGLSDKQEAKLKTSKVKKDTDGDGWDDYHEHYRTKTDPRKANTDGDRYNDSTDENPLIADTAVIQVVVRKIEQTFNTKTISDLQKYYSFNWGSLDKNAEIAHIKANIQVINNGTDYTNYVKYNLSLNHTCIDYAMSVNASNWSMSYKVYNNTIWKVGHGGVDRMNPGDKYYTYFTYTVYVDNLDVNLLRNITYCGRHYFNVSAYDVRYDRYP